MAKPKPTTGSVKVRVLVNCAFGKCGDVVEVDAAVATAHADALDAHPEAVAYAESQPKQ